MKQLLLLGLLVCIGFTAKPATLAGSATGGGMTLKYGPDDADSKIVWFELTGTNNGWVAIGLGELTGMANMDILKFTHDGTNVVATDQNVMGYKQPSDDATNDITLDSSSTFANNEWKVVFSRKMATGDDKDSDLVCGSNNISFGKGGDQNNSKHSAAPASATITLGDDYDGCKKSGSGSILTLGLGFIALLAMLI